MYSYRMGVVSEPVPGGRLDRMDNVHPALRSCWHPVCRSTDVADGAVVPVRLLGEAWAVARIDGVLAAFVDRCPHRMAPLSAGTVVDAALQCAYHGYRFGADGRCVAIPALGENAHIPPRAALTMASAVTERYGLVWMAIDPPVVDLIDVPEWDDPSFTVVALPTLDWNAGAAQMTDNFLDLAHFPYLHPATFGDAAATVVRDYAVQRDGFTFTTDYRHVTRHIGVAGAGEEPVTDERSDTFVYVAPFSIRLRIEYCAEDVVLTIAFFHQPVDATMTSACTASTCATTSPTGGPPRMRPAPSSWPSRPRTVPCSSGSPTSRSRSIRSVEVHTRADRITLEMRRILGDLVNAVAAREATS